MENLNIKLSEETYELIKYIKNMLGNEYSEEEIIRLALSTYLNIMLYEEGNSCCWWSCGCWF